MRGVSITRSSIAVLCVAGLLVAGGWAFWRARAAASAFTPSTDLLSTAALFPPTGAAGRGPGRSPTDQAVADWAARLRQSPRNDRAWTGLGDALMQKARETLDAAYYGRADTAFQNAVSLNPSNVEAIAGLAWVAGSRHEFERSSELATQALALDSDHHASHGLLGDAALEMGRYDAAFEHYQKMLDLRPDFASYSRAAHLLFVTGDTRKAAWLMQKAIAAGAPHAENTAWGRAQLALMLWHTGALVPAEQLAEAGLKHTPDNYHLLVVMGRIKTARKDYAAAIEHYRRAISIAPQHEPVMALGDLYALTGRSDEAERQYALVEAIHETNKVNGVRGDLSLAQFYADHDRRLPDALSIAEREYAQRPNVFAADTLAWCQYKNGRQADARKTIATALSRQTPHASFLFHAGMIHARLGNRSEAKRYLYRALSLNPNFDPFHAQQAAHVLKELGG
jgi:tetratricopeptide (TPR) repeat protein